MSERGLGPARLLIVATAAFGLSTVLSRGPTIALVLVGTLSLAVSIGRRNWDDGPDLGRWILGVTALYAFLSILGPAHQVIGSPPSWIFLASGLTWLGLGICWLAYRSNKGARRAIFLLGLTATTVFGSIHILSAAGTGFDVLLLHDAAADAIANGLSPYSSAVTVPNGAPAGAEFIVGYPYPPLTAMSYSVSSWTLGDPRWTSLVAWLVVLGVLGARSLRDESSDAPLGVMLMAAAIPGWPLVLTTGWTESLSLMFLALAIAAWSRPWVAGMLSGLFLGSKQYLLAGAPVYVANRLRRRWTRATWSAVGLVVSFVPIIVWGVPGFVDAAVRFHLDAPARPDGTSIVGLLDLMGVNWVPPFWVTGLAVIGVALLIWRQIDGHSTWLAGLGVLLSTALLLSSQAFSNYWFLIACVAALALGVGTDGKAPAGGTAATKEALASESEV